MPLFRYFCSTCNSYVRKLLTYEQSINPPYCIKCNTLMNRSATGPTTQVTEVLDNGLMGRKIERLSEAERLYKERSKIDPLKDD